MTMSRWLSLLPLGLLLLLAGYFAIGLTEDSRTIRSVLIDKPLPTFDLPSFGRSGETVSNETLKGHVSLINIFASWCITCRVEHPILLKHAKANRVAIYGLAWKDKPDELKAWLEELGNPYTAIADDAKGRTAIDFGVTGAPETFIVDKRGRIRFKQVGAIDDYIWTNTIEPLVKELEAEP
ncbi:MAG: DsbE family thiol:disulfide interchange protein [Alphaproteobacteria bacterium]|nr:DsbE family thiol:disulfide interchange protein [Alphaproteobacteria bacterium]